MPPKHKQRGRRIPPKVISKPSEISKSSASTPKAINSLESTNGLDLELENQIELEICWCCQQLQIGLESGKLQGKQINDVTKSLNILKSNTAPLVKKRQVMRSTFGDYRSKMLQDEKKLGKTVSQVKFVAPTQNCEKSLFLKKASFNATVRKCNNTEAMHNEIAHLTESITNLKTLLHTKTPETQFKFNFQQPDV